MIFIEDKKYLITSGDKSTNFYNLNNDEMISEIENANCVTNNSLC